VTADARWPCLAPRASGCTLAVAVIPNAKRTATDGLHDGALRVRLAAPPVDGKANLRLCEWLADELRCARRGVTVLRGATARRKQVAIDLPPGEVASWLDRQLAAAAG
jgi:uncharacterized protein (TIGR00251 family)